jgi:hypothetical protein
MDFYSIYLQYHIINHEVFIFIFLHILYFLSVYLKYTLFDLIIKLIRYLLYVFIINMKNIFSV